MNVGDKYWNIHRLEQILGFKIPLDGIMMMLQQRPVIDIIKLDERLMKDYKYIGSMSDFVLSKFGNEALEILEKETEKL